MTRLKGFRNFLWMIVPALVVPMILAYGNSCSLPPSPDFAEVKLDSIVEDASDENSDQVTVISGKPMVAVPKGTQILESMLQVTGITTPSRNTLTVFRAQAGTFSEEGMVETLTAPLVMAAHNLAGAVCADLIAKERTLESDDRSFFKYVNFEVGPSALGEAALQDSIRRMARAFWGRNESPEEQNVMLTGSREMIAGVEDDEALDTEIVVNGICATMLSSLSALEM